MSQAGHLPHHWHWRKSPPGWPSEVAKARWRSSATRGGEELLKRLLETGKAENLPTKRRCLIPLNQVFFVFRSDSMGNSWKDIHQLVEKMMKKYTKYGWHFPLPGRAHSSSEVVGTEVPRVGSTVPRAQDSDLKQKEKPYIGSTGSWQLSWPLPGSEITP